MFIHRVKKTSIFPGSEPVADRLQCGRVLATRESVGQLGETDAGLGGLPLGPLVPIDPDLDRIREVGAHLDERRTEVVVPEVEVEAGDSPVGLGEGEPHRAALPVLGCGEDVLVLLRHPDRGHAGAAGPGLRGHVPAHHLDLPVVLAEPDDRDVVCLGELLDPAAERGADLLQDRRRGDWIAQMPGHEPGELPTDLQVRHVPVEIDPVQALHVQPHVAIEKVADRQRRCHDPTVTAGGSVRPAPDSAV
jgi:hypothetical protein